MFNYSHNIQKSKDSSTHLHGDYLDQPADSKDYLQEDLNSPSLNSFSEKPASVPTCFSGRFDKNRPLRLARTTEGGVRNTSLSEWKPTADELCSELSDTHVGQKDGTYFVRACGTRRTDQDLSDEADILILDGDSRLSDSGEILDGCVPPELVSETLSSNGIPHVIYMSHSNWMSGAELDSDVNKSTKNRGGAEGSKYHKWRAVIFVQYRREQLEALLDWIFELLHLDGVMVAPAKENLTWAQAWYFSRAIDAQREFEAEMSAQENLDGYELNIDFIHAEWLRHKAETAVEAVPTRPQNEYRSVIDEFNRTHNPRDLLVAGGYAQTGENRYLHPTSVTGIGGTIILTDPTSGQEFVYSHSGNDVLCDGKRHDAFDLYKHFEHQGDFKAALEHIRFSGDRSEVVGELDTFNVFTVLNSNNKPKQVTENLEVVVKSKGITIRYNQITKRSEIIIPNMHCVYDEQENASLTKLTDEAVKAGMTAARIDEMSTVIAANNPYCPIQAYIETKPWDGQSRIEQFCSQLETPNLEFAKILIRKWLIQAVAAVYEPDGLSGAGILVLVGSQGVGKTRLLRDLTSGVADLFLEGAMLDPSDKDSVMTACSHWVVELGELDATFKKSDIAQLKAFITRNTDKLRRPYARKDSNFARRTVFAGTVNEYQFLQDTTGNRRFWPIEIQSVHRDTTIDYQQLWAEIKTHYDQGEGWHLSTEGMAQLSQHCEVFEATDPVIELLLRHYNFHSAKRWEATLMTDICINLGIQNPSKSQMQKLASAIKKYNGNKDPKTVNGTKRHFVPG